MSEVAAWLTPTSLARELQSFLDQGGPVLVVIMVATFTLWWLIVERHYFFWRIQPGLHRKIVNTWMRRQDKQSWYARQIRRRFISLARTRCETNLLTIKAVIAVAPLLGLLGTVTGMIHVFDAMAFQGTGNTRAMASGVSRATIPTMAGMVVSLSGMLFIVSLQRRANQSIEHLASRLQEENSHEKTQAEFNG